MWVKLRLYWRATALIVWTTGMWSIRVLAMIVLIPVSRRAEVAVRAFLLWIWAAGAAAIMNMRMTVSGTPPKPPYLLVTNHLTYLDIVLLSYTAGCAFVSRADVQHMPAIGFMAKTMNTLFIHRENARDTHRVNALIDGLVEKGYGVHFFAEGRISQDATVQPFKPSLLEPAASREQPVYYAAISYKTPDNGPPASEAVVWREPVSLSQSMGKVLRLPRLEATIRYGDEPITGSDRKALAEQLHQAVRDRFVPMQ